MIISFSFWVIRYYQFDKEVVRELLGKKLTGRLRKDLDDISEKTNIPLKSCRRQVGCYWWIHGLGQIKARRRVCNAIKRKEGEVRWA